MRELMVFSALELKTYGLATLMKARKPGYAEGTVREWKTGTFKKVGGGRWVKVSDPGEDRPVSDIERAAEEKEAALEEKAEARYNAAIFDHGVPSLTVLDVLEQEGIRSYQDLKNHLRTRTSDAASKLYRKLNDEMKAELTNEYGMKFDPNSPLGWGADPKSRQNVILAGAKNALQDIARSIITLRDLYSQPKAKLMVKVPGKTKVEDQRPDADKTYTYEHRYRYKREPVLWDSTQIVEAVKQTSGWSDMSKMPTPTQMQKMVGKGRVFRGKFDPSKPFEFAQRDYFLRVPRGEDADHITATVQQKQRKAGAKRATVTFEGQVKIPFVFAHNFLDHQIAGNKTSAKVVREMEASPGYRKAREKTEAGYEAVDPQVFIAKKKPVVKKTAKKKPNVR